MNPEIMAAHEVLLQLHVIDQELDALVAEARRTPAEIREEHAAIATLTEQRAAAAEALAATEAKQHLEEGSLAKVEKRKVRADARLPSMTTAGQIEATQRELQALGDEAGDLETVILELMDTAETQESDVARRDAQLAHATALVTDHEAAWAARKPVVAARVDELAAQREPLVGSLRSDIARCYQLGRNQSGWRGKAGITWTDSGRICLTCKRQVSARWLQECGDHTSHHSCDGCKRMLVKPPEDEGEEP